MVPVKRWGKDNLFEGWRGGQSFGVSVCWVGYFVLCGVLSFVFFFCWDGTVNPHTLSVNIVICHTDVWFFVLDNSLILKRIALARFLLKPFQGKLTPSSSYILYTIEFVIWDWDWAWLCHSFVWGGYFSFPLTPRCCNLWFDYSVSAWV